MPELTQWYSPAGRQIPAAAALHEPRRSRRWARSCGRRTPSASGRPAAHCDGGHDLAHLRDRRGSCKRGSCWNLTPPRAVPLCQFGHCTWLELGRGARAAARSRAAVRAGTNGGRARCARRVPGTARCSNEKLRLGGIEMPSWQMRSRDIFRPFARQSSNLVSL